MILIAKAFNLTSKNDAEGSMQKRSIIGTVDIYSQANSKKDKNPKKL